MIRYRVMCWNVQKQMYLPLFTSGMYDDCNNFVKTRKMIGDNRTMLIQIY